MSNLLFSLLSRKHNRGVHGWLNWFSICLRLRLSSQGPGIQPCVSLLPAQQSLLLPFPLPLPLLVFSLFLSKSINRRSSKEREKHAPPGAGSRTQGSIPGPWDHDLSQRRMPNWLSHPSIPQINKTLKQTHTPELCNKLHSPWEIFWVLLMFAYKSCTRLKGHQRGDFFFYGFIYLFMRDAERERQREKQAPHREPDVWLDPGSWDQALSQRQMLNRWATQVSSKRWFKWCWKSSVPDRFSSPQSKLGVCTALQMRSLWTILNCPLLDLMQNIDPVITFFSSRLLEAEPELIVEWILEMIRQGIVAPTSWRNF